MQGRLASLTTEFNSTAQSANRLLGSLINRGKGTTSSATTSETLDAAAQGVAGTMAASKQSARRSDVPPSLQKAQQQGQELKTAAAQAVASAQEPVKASRAVPSKSQQSKAASERPKPVRQKLSSKAVDTEENVPAASQGKKRILHSRCA